jgi:hypothetical protein
MNPDYEAERQRRWRRANPARWKELADKGEQRLLAKCPDYHKWAHKKWLHKNPDYLRMQAHLRRAGGRFTVKQFKALGNVCLCCGRHETELAMLGLKLVPDHVIPVSKGGTNDISNIQPLCHGKDGCNNHKGAKFIDYRPWMKGATQCSSQMTS